MSTLLGDETFVLEELDFSPPCAMPESHAAELVLRCRSCGAVSLVCRRHYEEWRRWMERRLRRNKRQGVACSACHRMERMVDALIEVVPL